MIDNTPIPQFRWFTRNPYIHILSIRGTNDMEESRIIPIRPFPDKTDPLERTTGYGTEHPQDHIPQI